MKCCFLGLFRYLSTSDITEYGLHELAGGGVTSEVLCPHLSRLQRLIHRIANDLCVARQVHALKHVDRGEEYGRLLDLNGYLLIDMLFQILWFALAHS